MTAAQAGTRGSRRGAATTLRAGLPETALTRRGRTVVGGFFLSTGGGHLGIVVASTAFYARFADRALFGFVREGWSDVFMATPALWGLCLSLGETLLGVLLLCGGSWAKFGWVGVIAFHMLLMLFGFGLWLWSLPALALLVPLAWADWPLLSFRRS